MTPDSTDSDDIKRSDFGSLKRSSASESPVSTSQNDQGGEEVDEYTKSAEELKSKVGSKKSVTTVGSSTLVPSEAISSLAGSIRRTPETRFKPVRLPTFSQTSTFELRDGRKNSMVFRRFDRVNARRLIALEAEIAELEERLEELDVGRTDARTSKLPKMSFEEKRKSERDERKEIGAIEKLLDMKLERYYKAVSRTAEVMALPEPVRRKRDSDAVVRSMSAMFAIIFLITAIVALYFITKPVARVGALCGFTIAFAIALITMTNARRHEVFVATAAYAAVLVVFISGNFDANTTNNSYNTYPANVAPIVAPATETIVQVLTQTQTLTVPELSSGIVTSTATIIQIQTQTATTTLFSSNCPTSTFCFQTAAPSATSAAAGHRPLAGLSKAGKAGVGFVLAVAGLVSLAWLTSFLVGVYGCAVHCCGLKCGRVGCTGEADEDEVVR